MIDKVHSKSRYALVVAFVILVSCQEPRELASEFPDYTLLTMEELAADVRLSFSGPEGGTSQLISPETRADESMFVLLEPQAFRSARTVSSLDAALGDNVVPVCSKACAQILKFKNQGIWVKGEVCKEGPIAAFSNLDVPKGIAKHGSVYQTSGLSLHGQLEFPDQVVCYETYFFHEGEVTCQQSCLKCGAGEFDCVIYSPSFGFRPTEMPDGLASSVAEIDCNPSDLTKCGGFLPGNGGIEPAP